MKSTSDRGPDDPTRYFLLQPLEGARVAADRVAAKVAEGSGSEDLLNARGLEALRTALKAELPRLSDADVLALANEIAATAHALATVEWRNAGHQPRDVPEVGPSALEAAVLVHLHGSPDSEPARMLANKWRMHAAMFGGTRSQPPNPSEDEMWRWSKLIREQERAVYSYWQEMQHAS